jgi:hypothetical protein
MTGEIDERTRAAIAIHNREQGLCGCGRPPKANCKSCAKCLASAREATKRRRKLKGHCRHCGKPKLERTAICAACKPVAQRHQNTYREGKVARGICYRCLQPATDGRFCFVHAEKNRATARAYKQRKRAGG